MQHLAKERSELLQKQQEIKARLEEIDDEIYATVKDRCKDRGSTTLEHAGVKLTVTIPPKITWDEAMLREIAEKIRQANDDPEQYITYKLSVPESKYKAYPEAIQSIFQPARTVTPGKRKIEVKNGF